MEHTTDTTDTTDKIDKIQQEQRVSAFVSTWIRTSMVANNCCVVECTDADRLLRRVWDMFNFEAGDAERKRVHGGRNTASPRDRTSMRSTVWLKTTSVRLGDVELPLTAAFDRADTAQLSAAVRWERKALLARLVSHAMRAKRLTHSVAATPSGTHMIESHANARDTSQLYAMLAAQRLRERALEDAATSEPEVEGHVEGQGGAQGERRRVVDPIAASLAHDGIAGVPGEVLHKNATLRHVVPEATGEQWHRFEAREVVDAVAVRNTEHALSIARGRAKTTGGAPPKRTKNGASDHANSGSSPVSVLLLPIDRLLPGRLKVAGASASAVYDQVRGGATPVIVVLCDEHGNAISLHRLASRVRSARWENGVPPVDSVAFVCRDASALVTDLVHARPDGTSLCTTRLSPDASAAA